jgi:hypothetical protein
MPERRNNSPTPTRKMFPSNASYSSDVTSDEHPINEVIVCYGDSLNGDDCDYSTAVVTEATNDTPDMFPESLVRANSPSDILDQSPILDDLMKKYPLFVPARLPAVPRKRPQPVCRFVNFMGTRKRLTVPLSAAPGERKTTTIYPTPYPTTAPTDYSRPDKRQKESPHVNRPGTRSIARKGSVAAMRRRGLGLSQHPSFVCESL